MGLDPKRMDAKARRGKEREEKLKARTLKSGLSQRRRDAEKGGSWRNDWRVLVAPVLLGSSG
jgi:hypothetical protein